MIRPDELKTVVLCRLWAVTDNDSSTRVANSLYPFVAQRLSKPEWRRVFDEALETARADGLVDKRGPRLTKKGRDYVKRAVGGRPTSTTWAEFKRKDLPRLFIPSAGSSVTTHLLSDALGCADARNPAEAVDQFITRTLGIKGGKVTLDTVRAAMLARHLGVSVRPRFAEVARLAAVKLSGARSGRESDVLTALVDGYMHNGVDKNGRAATNGAPSVEGACDGTASFVQKVLAVAQGDSVRRYGRTKTFIGSVWEVLRRDEEVGQLGESEFKNRLVEAHRRGALVLSRADLVAAMDPADVRASETNHLGATYHFINAAEKYA